LSLLFRIHSFSSSIILFDRDDFSSPRVYYEENRKKGADGMTSSFQKT
jgi:hypothetical protein